MFQLPQRLQIVNVETPLYAGVRFIPFTLAAPVGSSLSAAVAKKAKVPALYLVIFAATLQIVGFALLSTLPESQSITARQYGYEWIAGFGCGINISLLVVMVPFAVQERDKCKNSFRKSGFSKHANLCSCGYGVDPSVPCHGRRDWVSNHLSSIQWTR